MKVSIVIGSHNRSEYLVEVIKSCKELDYPDFEVIVIDSAPEPIPVKIQKMCDQYYHRVDMGPLSPKRNFGVEVATGEVVVFTDDDCVVHKEWIKELVKGLEKEGVMCCTGRTVCHEDFVNTEYERWFAFKSSLKEEMFKKKFGLQNVFRFGHGNNMAYRKDVFDKVGLFDNNLGVGTKGMASEDTDMFYRIYKKGYSIFYNPLAVVYHKHLVSDSDVPKTARRNGLGILSLLKKHPELNCLFFYSAGIGLSLKRWLLGGRVERSIGKNCFLGIFGVRK